MEPSVECQSEAEEDPAGGAIMIREPVAGLALGLVQDHQHHVHQRHQATDREHKLEVAQLCLQKRVPKGDGHQQRGLSDLAEHEEDLGQDLHGAGAPTISAVDCQVACVQALGHVLEHDDAAQSPDHGVERPGADEEITAPSAEAEEEEAAADEREEVGTWRPLELDAEVRPTVLLELHLQIEAVGAVQELAPAVRDGEIPNMRPHILRDGALRDLPPISGHLTDAHLTRSFG
mmetsp:Transcript_128736/g.412405  ORF Transcript_128736/g.412405 Transcript_128736/m.412405 type:complete len:233 (+) Transcript_128736:522-1220(+)